MTAPKQVIQMPELLIFIRMLILGIIGSEVYRVTFFLGSSFSPTLSEISSWVTFSAIFIISAICLIYAANRGFINDTKRLIYSLRIDLLFSIALGIYADELGQQFLSPIHLKIKQAPPELTLFLLGLLLTPLLSVVVTRYCSRIRTPQAQLLFLTDEDIKHEGEDMLENKNIAKSFAEAVLTSEANSKLVFGIDGPWGSGKTSFINLAADYWKKQNDVIVCRFEPLRYASEPEPGLSQRLIRDITDAIQTQVFAPEFSSVASRYSRLLKGEPTVSYFGIRFSFSPREDTVDDLLENINSVLERIGRRLIIVIDDLDRLDTKAVNNVLFVTRRAFNLSRATYILCYDTEILAKGKEEGDRAREFLEKFVTIKQSLFIGSAQIINFLKHDWQEHSISAIPADTLFKLKSILSELAEILSGKDAAEYLRFIGDLRKVKRFVNALLLVQMEKTDLGKTDFNKRDLINLLFIHLYYPGLFRRIYAEETEGRSGVFSVNRELHDREYKNSTKFIDTLNEQSEPAKFLLQQLFNASNFNNSIELPTNESEIRSRACFNKEEHRNLEKYLQFIVRFSTPEPRKTFVFYQDAIERVLDGSKIDSVLRSPEFSLVNGTHSHSEFWRLLLNKSHVFKSHTAEDAICTLIEYLPQYALIDEQDFRKTSIYYLSLLLDCAGWGRTSGNRRNKASDIIIEIAWRIYGEKQYEENGLIRRIAADERGVLGWHDLMMFRLQCSADQGGQLFNIVRALILNENPNAKTDGPVNDLATQGMRRLSQEVFKHFEKTYIEPKRNFFEAATNTPDSEYLGSEELSNHIKQNFPQQSPSISDLTAAAKSKVIVFVIYQLSNPYPPTRSGVGCGFYDASGISDGGGIAKIMNKYLFDVCFHPAIKGNNVLYFLDYCLMNLSNSFFSGGDEEGYFATKEGITRGLDSSFVSKYWLVHSGFIKNFSKENLDRVVITSSYKATYLSDLPKVFKVLDEISNEHNAPESNYSQ